LPSGPMKKIKWVEGALDNLDQIAERIAEDDPAAARRVVSKIRRAVRHLAQQPSMGRLGRVQDTRELVIIGTPYIVAYRIRANVLEVLCVLHSSQRWPESF
jgi:addiction module RelE/StbE family toxin